jgi:bifunctional non-homologous end joining protein LigD
MPGTEKAPIPADAREWRPQRVDGTKGTFLVENAIAEPLWDGTRVLVFFREADAADEWGVIEVIDEEGGDASGSAPRALDQLRRSILAGEAVVDGIITDQTLDSGVSMEFDPARPEAGKDLAFVAVDLLRVDRQPLFDVPLLERKRLLESVIQQSPLVRLSPWVTPPIHAWMRTWRGSGFRGAVVKAANSRYVPGAFTDQWAIMDKTW